MIHWSNVKRDRCLGYTGDEKLTSYVGIIWDSRSWFQIFFIFTPILGEMIQFDDHIFQMGWFNHQQEKDGTQIELLGQKNNDLTAGWSP